MLVGAGSFIGTLQSYRLLWINGRFSGHKTSFCFKLIEPFLASGYRLITNTSCVWADRLEDVGLTESGHLKAVVVLDEAGTFFNDSARIKTVAAYAAKMDVIYILPSFWPPTRAAQVVTCQPIFSLKSAGLPVIVYRWRVKISGWVDSGHFIWVNPSEIYGIYSRQDPGSRAEDIIEYLVQKTSEFQNMYGRNSLYAVDEDNTGYQALLDASDAFAEAADSIASLPVRKHSRRR
jgi:hypothetical protein